METNMESNEMPLMNDDIPALASRAALMDRLEATAADIRAVFAEDVEGFATRAVRARFLEDEAFSAELSDETLGALKARCVSDGGAFRADCATGCATAGAGAPAPLF